MKIVGVFYKAHEYAKDPKFLGCAENALGLREFLESKGHTYIVTDDKEGDDCGTNYSNRSLPPSIVISLTTESSLPCTLISL